MTPKIVHVDAKKFFAASRIVAGVRADVDSITTELVSRIQVLNGKCGDGPKTQHWCDTYDAAVNGSSGILVGLASLSNALASYHYRLAVTGVNHYNAEQANTDSAARLLYPGLPHVAIAEHVPSSYGVGSTHDGFWDELVGSAQDLFWPSANPECLFLARDAFHDAARRLRGQIDVIESVSTVLGDLEHPCKSRIVQECTQLSKSLALLAHCCDQLGDQCHNYGDDVNKAHESITDTLVSLGATTVAVSAAGFVLAFVSEGVAAVIAGIINSERWINCVNKIRGFLRLFARLVAESLQGFAGSESEVNDSLALTEPIANRSPLFAEKLASVKEEVERIFNQGAKDGYAQCRLTKLMEEEKPLTQEEWEKSARQLTHNKAKGDLYEEYVADRLGITVGKDGWEAQKADPAFPGRRLDFINKGDKIAIEAKSGVLKPSTIKKQLTADIQGLKRGWTVKWVLHEDPSPEVIAEFEKIKALYPKFSYEVIK